MQLAPDVIIAKETSRVPWLLHTCYDFTIGPQYVGLMEKGV
jgi:hypothetical protein